MKNNEQTNIEPAIKQGIKQTYFEAAKYTYYNVRMDARFSCFSFILLFFLFFYLLYYYYNNYNSIIR